MTRLLWMCLGLACVGIGAVGIVVPGLPTTVFFVVAAWAFSKSSPRLEAWVLGLPQIGPMVSDHRAGLGMPRRAKFLAIGCIVVFSTISIFLVEQPVVRLAILATAAVGVVYVWRRVPTREVVVEAFGEVTVAVLRYLVAAHPEDDGVRQLRGRIGELGGALRQPAPGDLTPVPHPDALHAALAEVRESGDGRLSAIGAAIASSNGELTWRVDDGLYYRPGADVGDGYRNGNMHVVLLEADDFAMGLFLLRERVVYKDHHHPAPEFYLNLTGPTEWRFDAGEWTALPAGSVLWNDPGQVHATRTGGTPWLSCWAWIRDVDGACEVCPEEPTTGSAIC